MKNSVFINDFITFKTKILIHITSFITIFFLIIYGKLVCPFLQGLAFIDFFKLLAVLYFIQIIIRNLIFNHLSVIKENQTPTRVAYKHSVLTWLIMGVLAATLFKIIYNVHIPWHSQLKVLSGYWFLGAGINGQIEYIIFEKSFKQHNKIDYKSFLDSIVSRISESIFIFTLVPSVTLLIMVIRYIFQDKIIPLPVAGEVIFIGLFLITVALITSYLYSRQLSNDLKKILGAVDNLEKGIFDTIDNKRTDEIGKISSEINQMIMGLKRKELIQKAFGHFVSPQIAENYLQSFGINENADLRGKGEIKQLTILMSDLRDFTRFSEKKSPTEVTSILNDYFSKMVEATEKHGGIVNKFIGDGLMAIFGLVSKDNETSATSALKAANEMEGMLAKINQDLNLSLKFGVGLHYGKVLSGYIGSKNRLEFTVIGSVVNQASRIEQETKDKNAPNILYSAEVAKELTKDNIDSKSIKEVQLKGIEKKVSLYSLSSEKALGKS